MRIFLGIACYSIRCKFILCNFWSYKLGQKCFIALFPGLAVTTEVKHYLKNYVCSVDKQQADEQTIEFLRGVGRWESDADGFCVAADAENFARTGSGRPRGECIAFLHEVGRVGRRDAAREGESAAGRRRQPRRRVVLPRPERSRCRDQGPRGVLERRAGRRVVAASSATSC